MINKLKGFMEVATKGDLTIKSYIDSNDEISVNIYDKGNNIQISIQDTGIGISEEKQEIIFERFRKADSLYNRKRKGSEMNFLLFVFCKRIFDNINLTFLKGI